MSEKHDYLAFWPMSTRYLNRFQWDEGRNCPVLEMDDHLWNFIERKARERKEFAKERNESNYNEMTPTVNLLGMAAEVVIGLYIGRKPDFTPYDHSGDPGFDFMQEDGLTMDVKGQSNCFANGEFREHPTLYEILPEDYEVMYRKKHAKAPSHYSLVTLDEKAHIAWIQGIVSRGELVTHNRVRETGTAGYKMPDGTMFKWRNHCFPGKKMVHSWDNWIKPELLPYEPLPPFQKTVAQLDLFEAAR